MRDRLKLNQSLPINTLCRIICPGLRTASVCCVIFPPQVYLLSALSLKLGQNTHQNPLQVSGSDTDTVHSTSFVLTLGLKDCGKREEICPSLTSKETLRLSAQNLSWNFLIWDPLVVHGTQKHSLNMFSKVYYKSNFSISIDTLVGYLYDINHVVCCAGKVNTLQTSHWC